MVKNDENKARILPKEPQLKEGFIEINSVLPTIEDLFKAGAHFGHKTSRWNPKMEPFIFSVNNSIHMIDLEKTLELFKKAIDFIKEKVSAGGKILFVGTKPSSKHIIEEIAKTCQMPYVSERWLGGTLTNYKTIKKRLDYLKDLEEKNKSGELEKYTKKERILFKKEMAKMQKHFGGLKEMAYLPSALFVVDTKDNALVVKEARRVGIPVVGICDTNSDPTKIDYPIPANDDAIGALRLILFSIGGAIKEAQEAQNKKNKTKKTSNSEK